jgi:hypothetical protein
MKATGGDDPMNDSAGAFNPFEAVAVDWLTMLAIGVPDVAKPSTFISVMSVAVNWFTTPGFEYALLASLPAVEAQSARSELVENQSRLVVPPLIEYYALAPAFGLCTPGSV